MKNITILIALFLSTLMISAQTTNETIIRVDSATQKFGKVLKPGQLVRVKNVLTIYQLRKATTKTNTLANVLADTTWFYANLVSAGFISGTNVRITATDTVTDAPVGTICYKTSDSTLYLKIRMTGSKTARWKVLSNSR
jgi:hypothetical protein